ncbi:uncharacterized protein LOC116350217 [Contarinia nasturtii]|uniref:uncharacterized protein LOC116350217 n=1 Tax=Contarinia nasturtii TaxID=265458 RepID=UPI0012D381BE|nr:uncharacterized protein LOC116350217 [Contarinia nasturtii]
MFRFTRSTAILQIGDERLVYTRDRDAIPNDLNLSVEIQSSEQVNVQNENAVGRDVVEEENEEGAIGYDVIHVQMAGDVNTIKENGDDSVIYVGTFEDDSVIFIGETVKNESKKPKEELLVPKNESKDMHLLCMEMDAMGLQCVADPKKDDGVNETKKIKKEDGVKKE